MFFILSKLAYWVIMPVNLVSIILVASLIMKGKKLKSTLLKTGVALLIFFTNPFFARIAINTWEPEAIEYSSISKNYEWGIVLAGITEPNRPPYDRAHFTKGADRLMHAIELYHQGKIKKILISGGSGILAFEGNPESVMLQQFAYSAGVKARDIIIETESRNTRENARNCVDILQARKAKKILLITSAFHMKRAKGCFNKLGYDLDTFPTDYYGGPVRYSIDEIVIPKLAGLKIWSILIKEWIGLLAYSMAGYV